VDTIFWIPCKDFFVKTVKKNIKFDKMTLHLHFALKTSAGLFGRLALTLSAQQ
jgi:hypothetical protein